MRERAAYEQQLLAHLADDGDRNAQAFARRYLPPGSLVGSPLVRATWRWETNSAGRPLQLVVVPCLAPGRRIRTLAALMVAPSLGIRQATAQVLGRRSAIVGRYEQTPNPNRPRPIAELGRWWWLGPELDLLRGQAVPRPATPIPAWNNERNPGPAIAVAMDEFFETEGAAQ